jgi:hypothetical protein
MDHRPNVLKIVCHSYRVLKIVTEHGWLPGARYTNLRDVKKFDQLGFLDIDWKNYDFKKHLEAIKITRPYLTVARDIEEHNQLKIIIDQANELNQYCNYVIIVPKDLSLGEKLHEIPERFILGFSVPTRTDTNIDSLINRPVHLTEVP